MKILLPILTSLVIFSACKNNDLPQSEIQQGGRPKPTKASCEAKKATYNKKKADFDTMEQRISDLESQIKKVQEYGGQAYSLNVEKSAAIATRNRLSHEFVAAESAVKQECKSLESAESAKLATPLSSFPSQGCFIFTGKATMYTLTGEKIGLGDGQARIPVFVHSNGGNTEILLTPKGYSAKCKRGRGRIDASQLKPQDFRHPTEREKNFCNAQCAD